MDKLLDSNKTFLENNIRSNVTLQMKTLERVEIFYLKVINGNQTIFLTANNNDRCEKIYTELA